MRINVLDMHLMWHGPYEDANDEEEQSHEESPEIGVEREVIANQPTLRLITFSSVCIFLFSSASGSSLSTFWSCPGDAERWRGGALARAVYLAILSTGGIVVRLPMRGILVQRTLIAANYIPRGMEVILVRHWLWYLCNFMMMHAHLEMVMHP